MNTNPLLHKSYRIPFGRISPALVTDGITQLVEESRRRFAALLAVEGERTYDNTLLALEQVTDPLNFGWGIAKHLLSVAHTAELLAAVQAKEEEVSALFSEIALSPELLSALRRYGHTDEAAKLDPVRARFLEKAVRDLERVGAMLPDRDRARLQEIHIELEQLQTTFGANVLESTKRFEWVVTDAAELSGLPESALRAAAEDAKAKGINGWRFTLQAPSYRAILTYHDNPGVREHFFRAYHSRAASGDHDNRGIVLKMLELRREQASMLGFATHADYQLADRMAKNGATALGFVEKMINKVRPFYERNFEDLYRFRCTLEGPDAPRLEFWDLSYYLEKMRKAQCNLDQEELRSYFPLPQVFAGMLEVVRRLYGITCERTDTLSTWHPDVESYIVRHPDGRTLGYFYADLFPREEKRDGAWMNQFICGVPSSPDFPLHLGVIAGNFSKAVPGRPPLMRHDEVTTLFHEFGHLLHLLLSEVEVESLAGTNVYWDFVELPSMIFENWCWERESLDLFASHFETGEKIPDRLFQALSKSRTFMQGYAVMRQLAFAKLDLDLHTTYDPQTGGDLLAYVRQHQESILQLRTPDDYAFVLSFNHIFGSGYDAGYYSYEWAAVLEADAFLNRFKRDGILERSVGEEFKRWILSRGNSTEPLLLYNSFMRRDPQAEPQLDALLKKSGMA